MQAKDLMVAEFERVTGAMPLLEAVDRMRQIKLVPGKCDVRCLIVEDETGSSKLLTEADVIRAILPWFFREKRFSEFVGKWLDKGVAGSSLAELWADLARGARRKKVSDVLSDAPLVSVDEEDSLVKVAYLMHTERVKSVPVVKADKIVGMVYRTAVFEAIAAEIVKPKYRASNPEIKTPKL